MYECIYISKRFQAPTTRPMIKQINIKCHIVYAEIKKRNEENRENEKN